MNVVIFLMSIYVETFNYELIIKNTLEKFYTLNKPNDFFFFFLKSTQKLILCTFDEKTKIQ